LENPNVRWDDIIGLDTAKRLVKEAVVYPIKVLNYISHYFDLLVLWTFCASDWFAIVMIRYIENIDISFLILIYRIVSLKNIEFFDISQYLLYIMIFLIVVIFYARIQKFIFFITALPKQ